MTRRLTWFAVSVVLLWSALAQAGHVLTARAANLELDGQKLDLWGVRVAAALYDNDTAGRLIKELPSWRAYGVNAVCVFAQGCDMDDFDHNMSYPAAFGPDGSLDPASPLWARLETLITECDKQAMVVNVGFFDGSRDEATKGDAAVLKATSAGMGWLKGKGFRNVLVDIANEVGRSEYDSPILKDPMRIGELLDAATAAAWPGALIGCSCYRAPYTEAKATVVFIHDRQRPARNSTRPTVCSDPGNAVRDWRGPKGPGMWERPDQAEILNHMSAIRKEGGFWFFTSGWKQNWPMHFEIGPADGQPSDHFAFSNIASMRGLKKPGEVVAEPVAPTTPTKPVVTAPPAPKGISAFKAAVVMLKGKSPAVAVDTKGRIHLVYTHDARCYYASLPPQSKEDPLPRWSAEEDTSLSAPYDDQTRPGVAVDSKGQPHVVSGTHYAYRDAATGKWTRIEGLLGPMHSIAVDSADKVWIAFQAEPLGIRTYTVGAKDFAPRETVLSGARNLIYPAIVAGANGIHLACRVRGLPANRGYDVAYLVNSAAGWQGPEWPDGNAEESILPWPRVALLPDGKPVVLWTDTAVKLSIRAADGTWPKEPLVIGPPEKDDVPALSADASGNIFVVQRGGKSTYRLNDQWTKAETLPKPEGEEKLAAGYAACASLGTKTYIVWEHGDYMALLAVDAAAPIIATAPPEEAQPKPTKLKEGEKTRDEVDQALKKLQEEK